MSFLHYFPAAISNHLSEKQKYALSYTIAKYRFDLVLSPPVIHYRLFQGGDSALVSVSCFGVRVSVMFHFMFVQCSLYF